MFIAALFTILEWYNDPRCPNNQSMDKENVIYTYMWSIIQP
jgi:hypothetical protein